MIAGLEDVRSGYDVDCDVVVVGSGPGGAVAAANFAEAGLRTIVVEAGPVVRPEDMTRAAPLFLARYYWEGGLRMVAGDAPGPAMGGRCVGGSSVVNSAIMLKLPQWVREIWSREDGLGPLLDGAELDRAFERVFRACRVAPTPLAVMGRRNEIVQRALSHQRVPNGPLPRAVHGCEGCADCITGCHEGRKQSVDRSHLREPAERGAIDVMTCSHVDRVDLRGGRAVGVSGHVVDPVTWRRGGRFRVRAKRVVLAAGAAHTPVILLRSGISGRGLVGGTLTAHISVGAFAIMDEVVDPWVGATQGWGAISPDIRGLKYEALWAAPSLIGVNWGGVGEPWLRELGDMKHAAVVALVYRANAWGRVRVGLGGGPRLSLRVPTADVHTLMRGLKVAVDGFLGVGARYVSAGMTGVPERFGTPREAEALLDRRIRPRQVKMTFNHLFGSCRISADPRRGPVGLDGGVRGVDGVYVMDGALFPSGSAVNPQATIMALSDVLSRRLAGLAA
ncbi:MAG: GMC family oxidoreductase [Myxococcales bacterium]|nr:GMC family oxidoreductase [Myxococcales bacterium]MCB9732577.1 GMC family oxidoreductase [Deltaproteobacteria bacterium]